MTRPLMALSAVIALATLAIALPTMGQTATEGNPAVKTAKKAAVAKKDPRPAAAAIAAAPLAAADDEQNAAAGLAHLGEYACEFDQTVKVTPNNLSAGYLDVVHKNQTWVMKPVLSSTGALRLEDVKGRMLMIQIANKSMVMDTQVGQRVVDGCQHEKQREFERALNGASSTGTLLKP